MKTKKDIENKLREIFNFPEATKKEKKSWPYKSDLYVSYKFLKGKKLFYKTQYVGVVEDIYTRHSLNGKSKNERLYIKTEEKEYSPTNCSFEYDNLFYNEIEMISLHPARGGKKFWTNGYLIKEKDYKSMYYNTEEYREKYEKGLNESLGTTGLTSPIQSIIVREKISNTMKERYGHDWFLCRGNHYSAITETMVTKFGIENLFYSKEWQKKNAINEGVSKIERECLKEIVSEFEFVSPNYCESNSGQFILRETYSKKSYFLDFYDDVLKVVIEFYGDFWHCNPNKYDKNYLHPIKKITAEEIWKKDLIRKQSIINNLPDIKFFEIWESDWRNNKNIIKNYLTDQIFKKNDF